MSEPRTFSCRRSAMRAALAASLFVFIPACFAQRSPATQATTTVAGKKLTIAYSSPAVRGRNIFEKGGVVTRDPTYPAWRAGADNATTFQTDADLSVGGLNVPKGTYTLFVDVGDPNAWVLAVNKQTGQWGLEYHKDRDLGRVKMQMSKPPSVIENLRYAFKAGSGNNLTLELAWENHIATVPIVVK